jgi:hypothetical protein
MPSPPRRPPCRPPDRLRRQRRSRMVRGDLPLSGRLPRRPERNTGRAARGATARGAGHLLPHPLQRVASRSRGPLPRRFLRPRPSRHASQAARPRTTTLAHRHRRLPRRRRTPPDRRSRARAPASQGLRCRRPLPREGSRQIQVGARHPLTRLTAPPARRRPMARSRVSAPPKARPRRTARATAPTCPARRRAVRKQRSRSRRPRVDLRRPLAPTECQANANVHSRSGTVEAPRGPGDAGPLGGFPTRTSAGRVE